MYGNVIFLIFAALFLSINGQGRNDDGDSSIRQFSQGRLASTTFDTQFSRGRCPRNFYQSGDECLFFANDGKSHAWKRTENTCSRRIAGLLDEQSSPNPEQPNMKPDNGVRQLVLNTPEKTEILRAFFRDYQEQNYAIRLPSDYNTLRRCRDGQDDRWPEFCPNSQYTNSTCYETVSNGPNDICIREVDCSARNLRLACEFTLPGSPELTGSKFRNCPPIYGRSGRLPKWAWITIIVGSSLLLLAIIIAVICLVKNKQRSNSMRVKKPLPEPRHTPETTIRIPVKRDPAAEPMLIRSAPKDEPDTGYIQPRSSPVDNSANA